MSDQLNALTQHLYEQGYTRERHPDTVYWSDWQNFGYKWEIMLGFTWETPCGLLIEGQSDVGRSLASCDVFYQHVWYCPENDNPLMLCPHGRKDCEHIPKGLPLVMCPCHQTQRSYVYECSVEKIEAEQTKEAHREYMEITGGSYCACVVNHNGYAGGRCEIKYDVAMCIQCQCKNPVCVIRKQPRDLSKVNIFYDVRRTWITRIGFLKEKKVEVTKGLKLFKRPVARTDAEIWLKTREAKRNPLTSQSVIEQPKKTPEDRRQEYFSKHHRKYSGYDYFEFHYEVENIRIARSEQRDLLQDLQDTAEGIEVVHAIDLDKAIAANKRAARAQRQKLKAKKAQKALLPPKKHEEIEQFSLFQGELGSKTIKQSDRSVV